MSFNQHSAQAQWPATTNTDNGWSIDIGAKMFDRPGDDLGIGLVFDPVTNETLFNSGNATDLDTAGGVDLRLNFKGPRYGNKWEFRTLLVGFDSAASVEGTDLIAPIIPGIFPESFDYTYESEMLSFELNQKRAWFPGMTVFGGARFISIDEIAQANFSETVGTLGGPFTFTGGQVTEARNSIYGLQAGFEFNMPISQQLYLTTSGRFGGYHNPTRVTTTNFTTVTGVTVDERTKSTGTFVAEIGGRINFELIPNCLTSYVGYDAMWIDGIALAPPQFLTTDPLAGIDTTNTPFMHAISLGFKLNY